MSHIAVIYSSVNGHTHKICLAIAEQLQKSGNNVSLYSMESCQQQFPECDKVVIGASIFYGKHRKNVFQFINKFRHQLDATASTFFTVNLVARKPNKNTPETNPYLKKLVKKTGWQADIMQVFAGKLNYAAIGPIDKYVIRFIMWMTKGPTDFSTNIEYTDWNQVDKLAQQIDNQVIKKN